MPVEWALCIVVPICKGKGDIWNCSCYGSVKLLEDGMKVVERVLRVIRLCTLCSIVTVNELQFGFLPTRGKIDAVFILRKLPEEYHAEGKKLCMCFVYLEKETEYGGKCLGNEEEMNTRRFGSV